MGYNSNHSTSKATRERQKAERLGEERYNNQGCLMKVVEYNKTEDIVVEFQDKYKGKVNTRYSEFSKGKVRNPYYPNVYGGMVGSKYPAKVNGKISKEYYVWKNMLVKCNAYGLICCSEWLLFENFYEWLHSQKNFDRFFKGKGWVVCKDIVKDNKTFSPDTCYLTPKNVDRLFEEQELNMDVPKRVLQEYKEHKEKIIKRVAEKEFTDGNITEECYKAMVNYKL